TFQRSTARCRRRSKLLGLPTAASAKLPAVMVGGANLAGAHCEGTPPRRPSPERCHTMLHTSIAIDDDGAPSTRRASTALVYNNTRPSLVKGEVRQRWFGEWFTLEG